MPTTQIPYTRLTLLRDYISEGRRRLDCICICGRVISVRYTSIVQGRTRSCGCLQREVASTQGGKYGSRLYWVWKGIRDRCSKSYGKSYKYYGGRGIKVCKKWADSFSKFEEWALSNGYVPGLTIDRKNNNKGYSPSNCQFISRSENSRKRGLDRRK